MISLTFTIIYGARSIREVVIKSTQIVGFKYHVSCFMAAWEQDRWRFWQSNRCRKISNDFPVPRNSVTLKKINPITDGFSHLSCCSNWILLVEIGYFRLSTIQYLNLLNWILLVLHPIKSQFDQTCCVHQILSNGGEQWWKGIPHDSKLSSSAPTIHLSVLCQLEMRSEDQ